MSVPYDLTAEWLETDGLGGFASGTVGGIRARRYHGLLLAATAPPTGRMMLVNGFDAWVQSSEGTFAISSQKYTPDVIHPDNSRSLESFAYEPWPRWTYRLKDGAGIVQEILVPHGTSSAVVTWRLTESRERVVLFVRPFLSGRDYHALHHENPLFCFDPVVEGARLTWRPYNGVPPVVSLVNGEYAHQPYWYRSFLYEEERARGLDCVEDLAAPGVFRFDLSRGEAVWIVAAGDPAPVWLRGRVDPTALGAMLRDRERQRRSAFASSLDRAADAYFTRRGSRTSIIAGYPWFTERGRDTFIALRGLCLATGRLEDARAILVEWAGAVNDGMLPNCLPDQGGAAEYDSVDAALWFIIAVHEFREALEPQGPPLSASDRIHLEDAVTAILEGCARGTRHLIHVDEDGLLAAGQPTVPLTWMNAKVGDLAVTPRVGKPVDVNALWLNALWTAREWDTRWARLYERGRQQFERRFWNEVRGCLFDVIDVNHQRGVNDSALRPNQLLAVGGLPLVLLSPEKARQVVDVVERHLWTPMGLRSLAPGEPGYAGRYGGGMRERDAAYHQGTAWPWWNGPFIEAWVRVRGNTPTARDEAAQRFLEPLMRSRESAGLGHVAEVADGDAPSTPGGGPFQAWSLAELLRVRRLVLGADQKEGGDSTDSTRHPRPSAAW
jgi:predicted glycogen debranching enzyme